MENLNLMCFDCMKRILILTLETVLLASAPSLNAAECTDLVVQNQSPQKNKRTKRAIYKVNIDCEACKKKIVENISFERGVRGLSISLENQLVIVDYDIRKTDSLKIAKAINKLGYKIEK